VLPYYQSTRGLRGGLFLVKEPVGLSEQTLLGAYSVLSGNGGSMIPSYSYSISFWINIEATNAANGEYMPIISYVNADPTYSTILQGIMTGPVSPAIAYNGKINTLAVFISQNPANGPTVITIPDFAVQKWNHVVFVSGGGVCDVFYNGVLANSSINTIPIIDNSASLYAGADKGLQGSICSVLYFNQQLKLNDVSFLYNSLRNANPPVQRSGAVLDIALTNAMPLQSVSSNSQLDYINNTNKYVTTKLISERAVDTVKQVFGPTNVMVPLSMDWYLSNWTRK